MMEDGCRVFVVADRNVSAFARSLSPGSPLLEITADEEHKTIDTVMQICRWLLAQGADRKSLLYAVGGGVTTDMAGFAASIYKRGIPYVNYPTTLLSQVDAGIGGKTGVNLDSYKNMIGVIVMPQETRICPEVLKTLPDRELRSGAAELLKSFIIDNRSVTTPSGVISDPYRRSVELLSAAQIDFEALEPLIKAAGEVKRRVVASDPYEKGLRRVLNLGHTYAHAIEWYQHSCPPDASSAVRPLSHGEAVSVGIVKAARISAAMGLCPASLADSLREDFLACSLPVDLPCDEQVLFEAMLKDKKAEGGSVNFVLIEDIGKVVIRQIDDLHKYKG